MLHVSTGKVSTHVAEPYGRRMSGIKEAFVLGH
jgi:hypothetical protein